MVIRLKQIPKLITLIKKYETAENVKPHISYIEKNFNDLPIEEALYPNFEKLCDFCNTIGIIKFENELIKITDIGNQLLDIYQHTSDFDNEIKQFFCEICFLQGSISKSILKSLSRFIQTNHSVWAPADQVYDLFEKKSILPLLYECDLLQLNGNKVFLNSNYFNKMNDIIVSHPIRLTQTQINEQLQLMKNVGNIGEELALKYEQKRLYSLKYTVESKRVKLVSIDFANAGYDILSFNGSSTSGEYDRYIEVKSSIGTQLNFFWSENEMNVARVLKEKYWIYFFNEVDIHTRISPNIPIMISDPINNIMMNSDFIKKINSYNIRQI